MAVSGRMKRMQHRHLGRHDTETRAHWPQPPTPNPHSRPLVIEEALLSPCVRHVRANPRRPRRPTRLRLARMELISPRSP